MDTYNDAKHAFLLDALGLTEGHIDDLYNQWLLPQVVAPVGEQTDDLELQWLRERTGVVDIAIQDGWVLYLTQLGVTPGHINDMLFEYWSGTPVDAPQEAVYRMDFDPNVLLRARDSSGGNDGALNSGIGLVGDGVAAHVRIPHDDLQNPPGDFTVAVCMSSSDPVTGQVLMAKDGGIGERAWSMMLIPGGVIRVRLWANGTNESKHFVTVDSVTNVLPRYLAFVWDSVLDDLRLYIDGLRADVNITVDNALAAIFPSPADIGILASGGGGTPEQASVATVYSAKFWHLALSDAEILDLANFPEAILGSERASYLLNEQYGEALDSPIFDSGIFGFHGTNIDNLATWVSSEGSPTPQHAATSFNRRTLGAGLINVPRRSLTGFDAEGVALTRPRTFNFANFSGADGNQITVAPDAGINNIFDGGGTVTFWYVSLNKDSAPRFLRKGAGWDIRHVSGADNVRFFPEFDTTSGAFTIVGGAAGGIDGLWHFVTLVYNSDSDANVPTSFVDGEEFTVAVLTQPVGTRIDDSAAQLTIGRGGQADQTLHGGIDLVAMSSEELTLGQHQALYEASRGEHQPPPIFITPPNIIPVEEGDPYAYDPQTIPPTSTGWLKIAGPAALTVDPVTGEVDWATGGGDEGVHPVTIEDSNQFGETQQSWEITVLEPAVLPPVITSDPPLGPINTGATYSYQPVADPVATSWAKISGPPLMAVDEATGAVSWPTDTGDVGSNPMEIQAINSAGTDNQSWSVEVVEAPDSPTIVSDPVLDGELNSPYSYQAAATGNPDPTFEKVSGPPALTVSPTGLVEWSPVEDDGGINQVEITAINANGTDNQIWDITVVGAPDIHSTPPLTVNEGEVYSYQALAYGFPVPTWAELTGPGGNFNVTAGGLVTWTPGFADIGANPVEIEATNSEGADQQPWSIEVIQISSAPVITSDPVLTAQVGVPYNYTVVATGDPDPTFTKTTGPAALDVAPGGLVTWTPEPGDEGANPVDVLATNVAGTDNQAWSIEVVAGDAAPEITSDPTLLGEVSVPYSYQAVATGNPTPSFTKVTGPGALTCSPTGLVEWTPAPSDEGDSLPIIIRATNTAGSDDQEWIIDVQAAPIISSSPPLTVLEDQPYSYQAESNGNPTPTWSKIDGPAALTVSAAGLVEWNPVNADIGPHNVEIQATNSLGSDNQQWTLTVEEDESEILTILDTFTDANGTLLDAHTPDTDLVGGGWLKESNVTASEIQNNAVEREGATGIPDYLIDAGSNHLFIRIVVLTEDEDLKLTVRREPDDGVTGGFEIFTNPTSLNWGIHKRGGLFEIDGESFSGGLPYTMEVTVTPNEISGNIVGRDISFRITDTRESGATYLGVITRGGSADDLEVFAIQ